MEKQLAGRLTGRTSCFELDNAGSNPAPRTSSGGSSPPRRAGRRESGGRRIEGLTFPSASNLRPADSASALNKDD